MSAQGQKKYIAIWTVMLISLSAGRAVIFLTAEVGVSSHLACLK
jgi:hypothetical protein